MKAHLTKFVGGLYVLFVALAVTIGAGQLYASSRGACDEPGMLGSCQGAADELCDCACEDEFGTAGFCNLDDCCSCAF